MSGLALKTTTQREPSVPHEWSVGSTAERSGQVHVPKVVPPTAGQSCRVSDCGGVVPSGTDGAGTCGCASRTSSIFATIWSCAQSTGSLNVSVIAESRAAPVAPLAGELAESASAGGSIADEDSDVVAGSWPPAAVARALCTGLSAAFPPFSATTSVLENDTSGCVASVGWNVITHSDAGSFGSVSLRQSDPSRRSGFAAAGSLHFHVPGTGRLAAPASTVVCGWASNVSVTVTFPAAAIDLQSTGSEKRTMSVGSRSVTAGVVVAPVTPLPYCEGFANTTASGGGSSVVKSACTVVGRKPPSRLRLMPVESVRRWSCE